MEFTEEQKAEIKKLITEAVNQKETEKQEEIKSLEEKLQSLEEKDGKEFARRLKAEVEKKVAELTEEKGSEKDEEKEHLAKQLEELKNEVGTIKSEKMRLAIENAAIQHNIENSAIKLLIPHVENELKEEGATVEGIIKQYAEENPYLVKKTTTNTGFEDKKSAKGAGTLDREAYIEGMRKV